MIQIGEILDDIPRLARVASSMGSTPERRIVWVRTKSETRLTPAGGPRDGHSIVEIDILGRVQHVFVDHASERAVRKLWGTFAEGTLRKVLGLPRVPPLRGLAAAFPEEEDRTRAALGLLALETEKEGLSARQLYEARGVDQARLADWLRRGWVARIWTRGGGASGIRYVLTDRGFEVWEDLEKRS